MGKTAGSAVGKTRSSFGGEDLQVWIQRNMSIQIYLYLSPDEVDPALDRDRASFGPETKEPRLHFKRNHSWISAPSTRVSTI